MDPALPLVLCSVCMPCMYVCVGVPMCRCGVCSLESCPLFAHSIRPQMDIVGNKLGDTAKDKPAPNSAAQSISSLPSRSVNGTGEGGGRMVGAK